jgi:hypothetical protein
MSKFSVLFRGADLNSHSIRNQILVWGILIGGILLIACLGMLIRSTPAVTKQVVRKELPGKSKVLKKTLPGKASSTKGAPVKKLPNRPPDYASKDWLNYRQKLAPFLESGQF